MNIQLKKVLSVFWVLVIVIAISTIFTSGATAASDIATTKSAYRPTHQADVVYEGTNPIVHVWINANAFTEYAQKEYNPLYATGKYKGEFEIEYQVWYKDRSDKKTKPLELAGSVPSRIYHNPAIRVYVKDLLNFDATFDYPDTAEKLYVYVELRWFSNDNPDHDIRLNENYYRYVSFDTTNSVSID